MTETNNYFYQNNLSLKHPSIMPKNKKNKAFIYLLLLCLLYVGGQQRVWGQGIRLDCGGTEYPESVVPPPISLNERVKAASAVFEGRVVDTLHNYHRRC
jgi:hypothetical protein